MQIFSIIVWFKIANSSIYVFLSRQVQLQLEPIRKNLHFLSSIFMLEFASILFYSAMYPIAFLNDRMVWLLWGWTLHVCFKLSVHWTIILVLLLFIFGLSFSPNSLTDSPARSFPPFVHHSFSLSSFLLRFIWIVFGRSHRQLCCIQFVRLLYRTNKWYFPSHSERYALQHGYTWMSFSWHSPKICCLLIHRSI